MKLDIKAKVVDRNKLDKILKKAYEIGEPFYYLIMNDETYKKLNGYILNKYFYSYKVYNSDKDILKDKTINIAINNNLDFGEVELL